MVQNFAPTVSNEPVHGSVVLPPMPPGEGDLLKLYIKQADPRCVQQTFIEVDTYHLEDAQEVADELRRTWSNVYQLPVAYKVFQLVDNSAGFLCHDRVILIDIVLLEPPQTKLVSLRPGDVVSTVWFSAWDSALKNRRRCSVLSRRVLKLNLMGGMTHWIM